MFTREQILNAARNAGIEVSSTPDGMEPSFVSSNGDRFPIMDDKIILDSLTSRPEHWDKEPCPYCGERVVYGSNSHIYGGRAFGSGMCYYCVGCHASVGVHGVGKATKIPLGILATPAMKKMKMKDHALFDYFWKTMDYNRSKLYKKLAKDMNIPYKQCHFGWFNEADLERANVILKTWYNQKDLLN